MLNNKALIVGIDAYSQAPLGGCVNDAEEIAKLLEENEDGSPNFNIKLKCNIQTKAELLDDLNSLFKEGELYCTPKVRQKKSNFWGVLL